MTGKCPKCDALLHRLEINGVDGTVGLPSRATWLCLTFNCPHCKAVLGAQIDPIAIKTDIVSELMKALRK